MEHLALELFDRTGTGSQFVTLPQNASISITETSELFDKGDAWSLAFVLNVYANASVFGSAGELCGSRLHELIHKRKARLWVDGLPLFLGHITLSNEVDVDRNGNIDVALEGGMKTFAEKIDGAKANQVPMLSDVQIGLALWRKRWIEQGIGLKASITFADGTTIDDVRVKQSGRDYAKMEADGENDETPTQLYPRLVYPKGEFYNNLTHEWEDETDNNYLNTDSPYSEDENGTPIHPFCNIALCYQKQGYEKTDENGNVVPKYNESPEAQRGYEYMPANRVNSAPCFFVAYWIRALMKHLGIHIDENQMLEVEDLRRLFFVNTNCAYEVPEKMRSASDYGKYGNYTCWMERPDRPRFYVGEYLPNKPLVDRDETKFECTDFRGTPTGTEQSMAWFSEAEKTVASVTLAVDRVVEWVENESDQDREKPTAKQYLSHNRYFHKAFASSECFPDVDIAEVISSLENGFGIRFLFDNNYQRVRIVLLRNIFRSEEVQDIICDVVDEDVKEENNIRGFRMTYGNSEDSHFYYKGFADLLPHKKDLWPDTSDKHDYSQWKLNARYADIIKKASNFDKTCYVTPDTGDSFGIKLDKDAKRYKDLHAVVFEFAGFMDAEDGDCTGEDDTIMTINPGFVPAIMNDLNMEAERNGDDKQRFALFVDEQMRPRRPDLGERHAPESYNDADAEYNANYLYADSSDSPFQQMKVEGVVQPGLFSVLSDAHVGAEGLVASFSRTKRIGASTSAFEAKISWNLNVDIDGYIYEGYRLYLQDNYEPNDDGVSPIETHDWGLTLGIMRGSGSDAYVDYSFDEDDGEGNKTWDIVPGSNATAHPDTCDSYGNLFDYNGSDGQTIHCTTPAEAKAMMQNLWPNSNIDLIHEPNTSGRTQAVPDERDIDSYIAAAQIQSVNNHLGKEVSLLFATATISENLHTGKIKDYAKKFNGMTPAQMFAYDAGRNGFGILVEVGSSMERLRTLLALQKQAFANGSPVIIDGGDNGVGVTEGRFSLKLRAEKPNPFFNPKQPESATNRRYLEITNPNLRGRGLMDQFHKEESYWWREARIVKRTVRMTLARLLNIDKTKRVRVDGITGFVKKMEYTVSNQTGLGNVTLEIMYI